MKRCPDCGASNKEDAQWCGQCLAKFAQDKAETSDSDGASAPPTLEERASARAELSDLLTEPKPKERSGTGTAVSASAGAVHVDEKGITWTCGKCDSVNDFSANTCAVCGATFAEAIKPPEPDRPPRDPNMAALVSLFLPGAGHGYLGLWGEAIARAVISTWAVFVTIFLMTQDGKGTLMAIVFGVIATGLWVVAAHDAFREAAGLTNQVILKRKFFIWVVMGLLMLSVLMVLVTVVGAS